MRRLLGGGFGAVIWGLTMPRDTHRNRGWDALRNEVAITYGLRLAEAANNAGSDLVFHLEHQMRVEARKRPIAIFTAVCACRLYRWPCGDRGE